MAPDADKLPSTRRWAVADASLRWTFNATKGQLVVRAFDTVLECAGFVKNDYYERRQRGVGRVLTKFLGWFGMAGNRVPPSAADPTNLTEGNQCLETEDDVLHLKKLPDFSGRLSIPDTEVLLQYLTVPYLRIPLVLQFFSDETRIDALTANEDLSNVLWASLFEPSLWRPPQHVTGTRHFEELREIPPRERSPLGTPLGLLFNELVFAPTTVLASLEKLLDIAIDKDPGRASGSGSSLLMFVTRLVTSVDHFVACLLEHQQVWVKNERRQRSGCGAASLARGLELPNARAENVLSQMHTRLRSRLYVDLLPILEDRAIKAVKTSDLQAACAVHAHIVLIYGYTLPENAVDIARLVSSLFFVFTHYRFSLELPADTYDNHQRENVTTCGNLLGVPDMTLFCIFQRHRVPLLQWLNRQPLDANFVLERALKVVAFVHERNEKRQWRQLGCFGGRGRFVPEAEAVATELFQQEV